MIYHYEKHGPLFIVYKKVDTGLDIIEIEDSRLDSEEKAKEHCRILNEEK